MRFVMLDRLWRGAVLAATLIISAGCGQSVAPMPTAAPAVVPVLAASELTVGLNRLPFGLLQAGSPLNDPALTLRVRLFNGADKTTPRSEADAVYRGEGLPVGLYVAYATFDTPGAWEAEISIPDPTGAAQVSRIRLDILDAPRAPAVGTPAIPSNNLTADDLPEFTQLTSDPRFDPDLYQISIADALAAKRPFLVAFSTPGYCQTAVCAPNLEVIKALKNAFKDQVAFIHVEVYPYPFGESFQQGKRVPAMTEWNLRTEPWTFLVDGQGVIQARYEGGITLAELQPAVAQLAAGQPVTPGGP